MLIFITSIGIWTTYFQNRSLYNVTQQILILVTEPKLHQPFQIASNTLLDKKNLKRTQSSWCQKLLFTCFIVIRCVLRLTPPYSSSLWESCIKCVQFAKPWETWNGLTFDFLNRFEVAWKELGLTATHCSSKTCFRIDENGPRIFYTFMF